MALQVAREAIVLLKNQDALLPLNRSTVHKIAVFGPIAVNTPMLGWGSGRFASFHHVDFLDGIRTVAGKSIAVTYTPFPTTDVSSARNADAAIVCVGRHEAEGYDCSFDLPAEDIKLISAVCAANPHTIVVNQSGAAVEMATWISKPAAILQSWFIGQEGGTAPGEIVFGAVNPSGHLPVTFERRLEDYPALSGTPATYPGILQPGQPYPKVDYYGRHLRRLPRDGQSGAAAAFPFRLRTLLYDL